MKKLKNILLILFLTSLGLEFFSDKYELFAYPENLTTILAGLVLGAIAINIFSKEQLKKKFFKKEAVIILAIIPLYAILDYFTENHLFVNFLIVFAIIVIVLITVNFIKKDN